MQNRQPAKHSNWRTPAEARPDLSFAVKDLQRAFLRIADNLRWYEQTWLGVPIWQLPDDLVALQRIVFDTNNLLSAMLSPNGAPAQIVVA